MSLEAAIAENTAAIRQLIAALANQPLPLEAVGALAYAQAKAINVEPPIAEPVQEVKPAGKPRAAKPVATPPASLPTVEAIPAEAASSEVPALTYDDIKVPFLTQLVAKKGRDAGAQLLREFGVADGGKLSDIPAERWSEVLEAIASRVAA